MNRHCDMCKHWFRPEKRNGFGNVIEVEADDWEVARDRGDEIDRLYGECRIINLEASFIGADDPAPLAVAKDGSEYKAHLYTQGTFGCVLHEEVTDEQ